MRASSDQQGANALSPTPTPASLSPEVSSQGSSGPNPCPDILAIFSSEINALSTEGKAIVTLVVKAMQLIDSNKNESIAKLQNHIGTLESRVAQLEFQLDDISQYERRDTIIISGTALPNENPHENTADVVVRSIKDNLHVNISHNDINIAHRLGTKKSQLTARPIIAKLHSRQLKSEIMSSCITLRPNLHINESLTTKRRALFKIVWDIRKKHRELFQQCYTQDGKIVVKLKNSNLKHIITTDATLSSFLDKYPVLKQSANT